MATEIKYNSTDNTLLIRKQDEYGEVTLNHFKVGAIEGIHYKHWGKEEYEIQVIIGSRIICVYLTLEECQQVEKIITDNWTKVSLSAF